MKYATIAARSILGLLFLVFGAMYFFNPMEMPLPKGHATAFMGALAGSGYLGAIKIVEFIGGALTLSGRYTPTGLLFLGPVIVNIVFFDLFMLKTLDPAGLVVALLGLFVLYAYRRNFLPLLTCGCGTKA